MTEPVKVTVTETPVSVTISDDTPVVTITDNETAQVTVTQAATQVTVNIDEQPRVTVNTGLGGAYDRAAILAMIDGHLDLSLYDDIINGQTLWGHFNTGFLLTSIDGANIQTASATYTDTQIQFLVSDLEVRDGEINAAFSSQTQTAAYIDARVTSVNTELGILIGANTSSITQNATSIDSIVTGIYTELDGRITTHGSRILQTEDAIISTVSDISTLDDKRIINESAISQTDDRITAEVLAREALGLEVIENRSEIELTAESLALMVVQTSTIDDVVDRIESAEITLDAHSANISVVDQRFGDNEYVLSTVQTTVTNQWGVTITEDLAGNVYSTGFGLILHPIWLPDTVYTADYIVHYNGEAYTCLIEHTATQLNRPDVSVVYWEIIPGGVKSEFIVKADNFKIYTSAGPQAVFNVDNDVVTITGQLVVTSGSTGFANFDDLPEGFWESVTISGDQTFKYLAGASAPLVSSIPLTATLTGTLTTYDWEYWDGSVWVNLSGTQDAQSYNLAHNNAAWGSATVLKVRCLSGTLWDEMTIVKLFDGVDGIDAKTGFLTNESHTVPTASDGTGASYTTAGGTFKVFNGVTDVTTSSSFSGSATKNGLTLTIGASTGIYSLSDSSWTSDSESFSLSAVYAGTTITKVYTISKAKAGATGDTGAAGPGLVYRGTFVAGDYYYTSTRRDVIYTGSTYLLYNVASDTSGNYEASYTAGNWTAFSATFDSVATKLLLAEDTAITKNLHVGEGTGANTAGMSGVGSASTDTRIWAGGVKASAPFRVNQAGKVFFGGEIEGTATTGKIVLGAATNQIYGTATETWIEGGANYVTLYNSTAAGSGVGIDINASQTSKYLVVGSNDQVVLRTGSGKSVELAYGLASSFSTGWRLSAQASTNAHTLDDYEEGYYTPALTATSGTITLDTSHDQLAYTKIGRLVTVSGYLLVSTVSSPTGSLVLSLPVAIASLNESAEFFTSNVGYSGLTALTTAGALTLFGDSGSHVVIHEQSTTTTLTAADKVKASSAFYFTFSYLST